MTLIDPAYCSESDMQRYLSSTGVTAFADHDASGTSDTGVVDDCINQATEEINGYCLNGYTAADLDTSTLINRWCTTLACYFLALRRGNPEPDSLAGEFQRIMALLEKVAVGAYQIPGLALRADLSPGFSNIRIDRRYPYRKQRVEPNSTQASSELQQDKVPYAPVIIE